MRVRGDHSKPVDPPVDLGLQESFAQCGEDLIVSFLFNALGIHEGFYLDIGAHHPSHLNNTLCLYNKGWRGVNVDPLADNIALFEKRRPRDTNIVAGVGEYSSVRKFYRMDAPTLSTFDERVAEAYSGHGHEIYSVSDVKILSVRDLIADNAIPADLDLLSIDIEGGELGIITNMLEAGVKPKVIICETAFYERDIRRLRRNFDLINSISDLDYMIYADTYINTIFADNSVMTPRPKK